MVILKDVASLRTFLILYSGHCIHLLTVREEFDIERDATGFLLLERSDFGILYGSFLVLRGYIARTEF